MREVHLALLVLSVVLVGGKLPLVIVLMHQSERWVGMIGDESSLMMKKKAKCQTAKWSF